MFRDVTIVLNERKHLEMVTRSVPDSVSLILGGQTSDWASPFYTAQNKSTCFAFSHSSNAGAASWDFEWYNAYVVNEIICWKRNKLINSVLIRFDMYKCHNSFEKE